MTAPHPPGGANSAHRVVIDLPCSTLSPSAEASSPQGAAAPPSALDSSSRLSLEFSYAFAGADELTRSRPIVLDTPQDTAPAPHQRQPAPENEAAEPAAAEPAAAVAEGAEFLASGTTAAAVAPVLKEEDQRPDAAEDGTTPELAPDSPTLIAAAQELAAFMNEAHACGSSPTSTSPATTAASTTVAAADPATAATANDAPDAASPALSRPITPPATLRVRGSGTLPLEPASRAPPKQISFRLRSRSTQKAAAAAAKAKAKARAEAAKREVAAQAKEQMAEEKAQAAADGVHQAAADAVTRPAAPLPPQRSLSTWAARTLTRVKKPKAKKSVQEPLQAAA